MKIIINATNIIEDRPLREVERLINKGLAHLPEVIKSDIVKSFTECVDDIIVRAAKLSEITYEDLDNIEIFREPSTEVDLIEPIPVDKYVSFDEPKKTKKKLFHR